MNLITGFKLSLYLAAGLLAAVPANAADRVAFVVGVDQYDHMGPEGQLRVAVSDARLMAKTLASVDPPFEVTLLEDETYLETVDAFDQFIEKAKGAECALVYFAGHGVEYYGENFLLNRDTSITSDSSDVERMKRRMRTKSVSLQVILDDLDSTSAQVKVVIVDACRNNPLRIVDEVGTRSLLGSRGGLAAVTAPSGTLISYSADAGQMATDGLFTEVLAKNLKVPGQTLMQVFASTRVEVRDRSAELAERRLGVRHEPAEYVKLNPAALKFTFVEGEPVAASLPNEATAELEAQIVALQATVQMLQEQGVENEALKAQLEKMAASMAAETKIATPATGNAVAKAEMPPAPAEEDPLGAINQKIGALAADLAATEAAMAAEESEEAKEALRSRAAQLTALMMLLSDEKAEMEEAMAVTNPASVGGHAASRGMEGTKAGEVRVFGGIEMVWCPPGTFLMGSPEDEEGRGDDEKQHEVTLTQGFWMAKTECTQQQWESVIGNNPSVFAGSGNLPVERVSWENLQEWLGEMNVRYALPDGWRWDLPTEAQWEYACRAGTETPHSFGGDVGQLYLYENFADKNVPYDWADRYQDDGIGEETAQVGSYRANPWGLSDMHGNVSEWCRDKYGEYPTGSVTDPEGAKTGSFRVYRGGSWTGSASSCRSAIRDSTGPASRSGGLGFRPVVSSI